jgi:chromosome segregation and condensation protein ScpB
VLAIVAHEQPVTRADIRSICGVDSDAVIKTLMAPARHCVHRLPSQAGSRR